jgi:hypothetical protein
LSAGAADEFNKQPTMGLSVGYGSAEMVSEIGSESGIVPGFRFLLPVSKNWKLGLDMQGWTYLGSEDPRPQRNIFYFGPIVTAGRDRHGPFLGLSFGFGAATYEIYDDDGRRDKLSKGGWGFGVSAGWMFQTSEKFAVGPRLDYVYLDIGDHTIPYNDVEYEVKPRYLALALAIQFP